jgi:hypothetical protein
MVPAELGMTRPSTSSSTLGRMPEVKQRLDIGRSFKPLRRSVWSICTSRFLNARTDPWTVAVGLRRVVMRIDFEAG